MAKFCKQCGAQLKDTARFCTVCGAAAEQSAQAQPAQPPVAGRGAERRGIPAPGFSDRVNHPQILAAVKKNRNAAKLFLLIIAPLPLLGFVLYALISEKMELAQAALYGGIVSAIFAVFALVSFVKERAANSYDAVVIDKRAEETYRHKSGEDRELIMKYTTVVRTDDGKQKKIVEWEGPQLWAFNYLNVGDRFRCHPQFHFPYELYDKSRAPYIACVSCGMQNNIDADRCGRCGLPLLK